MQILVCAKAAQFYPLSMRSTGLVAALVMGLFVLAERGKAAGVVQLSPAGAEPCTIDGLGRDVLALLDALEVEQAAYCSISMAARIKAEEKAYSQALQRAGKWSHLWRVVGEYANYSVFDVESNDELHDTLSHLPLFPFMKITVTPPATHPSSIV